MDLNPHNGDSYLDNSTIKMHRCDYAVTLKFFFSFTIERIQIQKNMDVEGTLLEEVNINIVVSAL